MSIATLTQVPALHPPSPTPHTSPAPAPATGDVSATLNFHSTTTDGAAPYHHVVPPPTGPQSNVLTTPHTVTIRDLRGHESAFTLDRQSFQPVPAAPTSLTTFTDDALITQTYYPEIEALIRAHLPSATDVVIFDHTVRRAGAPRAPVLRVHVDQTVAASYQRVQRHLPAARAAEVLRRGQRVRIVNVWRPLGAVVDCPLALADSRTVREEDLVPVRHIYPDREGATLGVRWGQGQEWWYWGAMARAEALLIKCFDTDTVVGGGGAGRRGRTPHTAFVHPGTPEALRGSRESIEVRCLVVG